MSLLYTQQNILFLIGQWRMHKKVIECNLGYRVQYGSCYGNAGGAPNLNTKAEKDGWQSFALSNQNIVEQLKNAKNKNTLKATQTWSNV